MSDPQTVARPSQLCEPSPLHVGAYHDGRPLRPLAHEKNYERLNIGQTVPLGVEAADNYEVHENSNLDVQVPGTPRAVLKHGNSLFVRPCCSFTGDELPDVEGTTLYSCTVEMLSLDKRYDVVVIDEIQMIAGSQTGGLDGCRVGDRGGRVTSVW
jgi:ATP-dependent RNA helicase SUPV3L1/SUV3